MASGASCRVTGPDRDATRGCSPDARTASLPTSIVAERERRRIVLYESFGASDPVSLHRARAAACWKAAGALLNRLAVLASSGWADLEGLSRPSTDEWLGTHRSPSTLTVARHAASVATGVAGRRLRKLAFRDEWFLATRLGNNGRSGGRPTGRFCAHREPADASVCGSVSVRPRRRAVPLLRELLLQRGRASIWFVPLNASGRPAAEPRPALEREYHLSYPFVFGYAGEIFMIPESWTIGRSTLSSDSFPEDWQLEQTLFSECEQWTPRSTRPMGASICSPTSARKAPPSTTSCTSSRRPPHRPVAASSSEPGRRRRTVGTAGRPVVSRRRPPDPPLAGLLRQIRRRGRPQPRRRPHGARLPETIVGRLEPNWMPGLSGTHTLNIAERLEAIEASPPRSAPLQALRRS